MNTNTNKWQKLLLLVPMIGAFLFSILYFIAAQFYPGGSQVNSHSTGFSWFNNYWCNLLNRTAINGQYNPAQPIAVVAMLIVCVTLAIFWYIFPLQAGLKRNHRLLIQVPGIVSMITGTFLLTRFHDTIVNLASSFGVIAVAGTLVALYKLGWTRLFWLGIFNVLLVAINNVLYYGNGLIFYLPFIQKITFGYFLLWICLVDLNIYRKAN